VTFTDTKLGINAERTYTRSCAARPGPVAFDWDGAEALELSEDELEHEPREGARFGALPPECAKPRAYDAWRKSFGDHLARNERLSLWTSELSGLVSAPDESEREFRLRVAQALREQRDEALAKLRAKHAPKLLALEERKRKREQALEVQREQASSAKLSTALSFGSALLGAFLGGRKSLSGHAGRAASAARGVSRSSKESSDVDRAAQDLSAVDEQLRALQEELDAAAAELAASYDPARDTLSARELAPKKSAIAVRAVVLAWAPYVDRRAAWRGAAATP
jgi:hypothetical protein